MFKDSLAFEIKTEIKTTTTTITNKQTKTSATFFVFILSHILGRNGCQGLSPLLYYWDQAKGEFGSLVILGAGISRMTSFRREHAISREIDSAPFFSSIHMPCRVPNLPMPPRCSRVLA